jgi:hypothetical protein
MDPTSGHIHLEPGKTHVGFKSNPCIDEHGVGNRNNGNNINQKKWMNYLDYNDKMPTEWGGYKCSLKK